jgi:hypothetical protein
MGSIKGVLMLAIIQALQVGSIFLPGVPVWIAAVILYPVYIAFRLPHKLAAVKCTVFISTAVTKANCPNSFSTAMRSEKMGLIKTPAARNS